MTYGVLDDHGCSCHINPPCQFCTSGGTYDENRPILPADSALPDGMMPIKVKYSRQFGWAWCHRSCGDTEDYYATPAQAGNAGRQHLTECPAANR